MQTLPYVIVINSTKYLKDLFNQIAFNNTVKTTEKSLVLINNDKFFFKTYIFIIEILFLNQKRL
jgi:hypothetical protein